MWILKSNKLSSRTNRPKINIMRPKRANPWPNLTFFLEMMQEFNEITYLSAMTIQFPGTQICPAMLIKIVFLWNTSFSILRTIIHHHISARKNHSSQNKRPTSELSSQRQNIATSRVPPSIRSDYNFILQSSTDSPTP